MIFSKNKVRIAKEHKNRRQIGKLRNNGTKFVITIFTTEKLSIF